MSVVDPNYIIPGRCLHCGHKITTWSPQQVVDALHVWVGANDGLAPTSSDWREGTPEHPACSTVQDIFGSWDNGLKAAGIKARARGARNGWTQDLVADAMLDWLLQNGRWPTYRDWYRPGLGAHPHAAVAVRLFGTWNAAKRYAGWDGVERRTPKPADFTVPPDVFRCAGCGGDEYSETIGCNSCWDRKRTRAVRAAAKNGTSLSVVESPLTPGDSDAASPGGQALGRPVDLSTETTETAAQAA